MTESNGAEVPQQCCCLEFWSSHHPDCQTLAYSVERVEAEDAPPQPAIQGVQGEPTKPSMWGYGCMNCGQEPCVCAADKESPICQHCGYSIGIAKVGEFKGKFVHVLTGNWLCALSATPAAVQGEPHPATRFDDFDDADHPFRKWWEKHGQFMLSGGGRRESIWAARGWIAHEQLVYDEEVSGDSLRVADSVVQGDKPAETRLSGMNETELGNIEQGAPPAADAERWRVGRKLIVGRKVTTTVYSGDRPVCNCHSDFDAALIVAAVNALRDAHPEEKNQ